MWLPVILDGSSGHRVSIALVETDLINLHSWAKGALIEWLLERKLDELLILAAISTRCDEATAERIQQGDPETIVQYYRACQVWIDSALVRVLTMCAGTLKPSEQWLELAKKPKDFDKVLDKLLRAERAAMKLLHRIPDHRPSANLERDRTLFQLKSEHPEWSFGQLAIHYNRNRLHPNNQISDKQAERCCKQEVERLRLKVLDALKARNVHLQAKSLSEEELGKELPSPELALEILTKN
jgi:hypothetical protein